MVQAKDCPRLVRHKLTHFARSLHKTINLNFAKPCQKRASGSENASTSHIGTVLLGLDGTDPEEFPLAQHCMKLKCPPSQLVPKSICNLNIELITTLFWKP